MTRILTAVVCPALLAAVACGGGTPTSPSGGNSSTSLSGGTGSRALTGATITGTVVQAAAPPSAVTVSVTGTALSSPVDASGAFQLGGVPTGDVQLVFSSAEARPTVTLAGVSDQEVIELQVGIAGNTATVQRVVRVGQAACTGGAKPGDPVPTDSSLVFDDACKPIAPVEIKKTTNGQHVEQAPGPTIPVGNPVLWTYLITNRSPLTFSSLSVTDDRGVAVSCPKDLPAPGTSVTCTGSGTAVVGQYRNVGTVTVTANGRRYTASDSSYYMGTPAAGVTIQKYTNGQNVNQAPGPSIPVGSTVTWTYVVTNTSASAFSSVSVTDDRGVAVACPRAILEPGASMTCSGSGAAVAGQYRNVGTVVATGNGNRYTDSDDSYYFGGAVEEEQKVDLCHRTGNGSYHLINVSVNAEPAHRAHGDAKPGEAVPGNPGHVFTSSCTVN